MTKVKIRVLKRNNGDRIWRYEYYVWVVQPNADGTEQAAHSYTITARGAYFGAKRAARKYLAKKKRSGNSKIVKEIETNV